MRKINLFFEATEYELAHHNDVCPICYKNMDCTKITNCYHFFHSECIRMCL